MAMAITSQRPGGCGPARLSGSSYRIGVQVQFSRRIEFGLAETPEQMEEVWHVRNSAFARELHILFEDGGREALRDRHGLVFLLRENGIACATLRLVKLGEGLSKIESLPQFPAELARDACWEISRLSVASKPQPGSVNSLKMLLFACRWLLQHTQIRSFVACCHGALKRRYELLGAETIVGPFELGNRRRADYYVIKANLLDAVAATAELPPTEGLRPCKVESQDGLSPRGALT
jgi:hypothetical protein